MSVQLRILSMLLLQIVIASGGITSLSDVGALKDIGAYGAIIGRALYTADLILSDTIVAAR